MGSTAKEMPAHRAHTMTGETQHARAIKESDNASKQQESGSLPERFSAELKQESAKHYKCGGLEPRALSRTKECTQREAVIRPQQTGKIDFKSLQNRPKFSSDRTWHSSKGSPQSPSGKSRTRDKSKRSGKAERGNPQQLYRLSISNPRANPTIGIAYPQQKVTPPKKLEAGRGPISGSYRFHVPSIPEREAELQQEELSYNRCFQEASSNITSTNYTSQADSATGGTSAHQHPAPPQQQPSLRDNSNSQPSTQLLFPEFPVNRAASWQSPDKSFSGANYGASSQKLPIFPEGDKVNSSLVPLQFQYGYPSLQDTEVDPFPCDQNNHPQDYLDIALATAQVTHSSFTFHASGEGQEDTQTDSQFSNKQPEGRPSYAQLPQHVQYLQSQHETQSSLLCHKSRSKHLTNSENSVSGLHKIDQSKGAVPDNPDPFNQVDGESAAPISVEKQSCPPSIESTANQRILTQGNTHHARNIAQGQSSQMLSPSKAYSSSSVNTIHVGSVPLEESIPGGSSKTHSRLLETWDGANKTFSSMDQNSALYSNMNDKCQFQCQPTGEQRQSNSRMAWQQIQLTSAIPKQNRIQLSRQLSNQKLTFPIGGFEWQESKKPHKNSPLNSFHNKRPNEAFTNRRPESIKEHNSNISAFPFEHRVESVSSTVCDTRNKSVCFGVSQSLPGPYSKTNSHAPSQGPQVGLMTTAAYESPLSSPLQTPASTSPCSSVSPASHSPVNISPEDSQVLMAGPPPPFYHQNQEKTLIPLDHLNSNLHHFHTDLYRNFPNPPERPKEDILSYMHNNKSLNPNIDGSKSCPNSYGIEHPPPPYSAHQLLASSLAAANLDQLDVLLTCKQCDQNFNNLVSFLDHKQYCAQHMSNQNKSVPKVEEHRKYQTDCTKTSSSGMGFPISRCPSDPHLSLLGLNKNGELMSDSETKGDIKEEPLKLNFFGVTNSLPITLPDLEMDDAKLDSLITEALNGLGYSDNAEIDSSFIDAFVDDDLTTNLNMKAKDSVMVNSRSKHEATTDQRSQTQTKNLFDLSREYMRAETKHTSSIPEKTHQDFKQEDKANCKEVNPRKKASCLSSEKSSEEKEWTKEGIKTTDKTGEKNKIDSRFLLSKKFSERCRLKSFQERPSLIMPSLSHASSANWSMSTPRPTVKEGKRRKAGGGTWSKELIHKIVQQKNKPHKLHVKGTKNLQFSLVTERLTPAAQSPKFGEYDYVSDSDEESESLRLTSRGRLGHAGRCRYTYSKEYKGKYTYSRDKGRDWVNKGGSALWKHQPEDNSVVKVAEQISPSPVKESSNQRMRRRSSRSSSSSELSEPASVSSESITSPKTAERTDSESERALAVRSMSSNNVPLSDSFEPDNCKQSLQDMPKEPTTPTTPTTSTALSSHLFSKNTKRYGSAKFLLSHDKGLLPSSRVLSSRDRGSESTAKLPKTSGFQNHGEDHDTEQESEKEHSAAVSMVERDEEPSPIKSRGKMSNGSFTGTQVDFQTTGVHCKLTVAEVMPDVDSSDSKKSIKNENCDFSPQDKLAYKGNEHGKLSNYDVALQQSSESLAIPVFETIGDAVFSSKEEIQNIDCDILPNSSQKCTAHVEETCLCPLDMQRPAIQVKEDLVPFTIEPDQSLIKSPLSFDTSSMFGDLTVGGFDNSLYTDVSKESFNTFITRNDKRELFESPSPHLGLKDWDLIVDVPPMLPEEISPFKDPSEKAMTKKPNSSHIPLALPDKIMEDSNFISGLSEDELEIKRIVTELETQLQIAKLNSPLLLPNKHPRQLSKSHLSALPLDTDAGNDQSSMPMVDEVARELSASSPTQDPNLSLWSSPSHLGLLEVQQDLHTPVHDGHSSPEHSTTREDPTPPESPATKELQLQETEGMDEIKDPATDFLKSEEMLENEMYTENLMKSLEVISDSIFNKGSLTAEIQKSNPSQFLKQDQPCKECPDTREQQNKKQESPSKEDESQISEKHDTLFFPGENADCFAETSDLSTKTSESETQITICEPESRLCEDEPVNENFIGVNERLKVHDTDLLLDKSHIIEEKIKDDKSLFPEISENCHMLEEGGDDLRDKEHDLQPPKLFLSDTVQSSDKELLMASYPIILSADQPSIVPDISKEDEPPLLNSEECQIAEENLQDSGNTDSSEKSADCEESNKGGAEDFKKENSHVCWDLLHSTETEEVQSLAVNEEVHKASPFRCNTLDNATTDTVTEVNHERNTISPYKVDQERTAETVTGVVNLQRTTDISCQVNQEMLCGVDQDRTKDVVSQINQEMTTGMPCKVKQEIPCQIDQDRTMNVVSHTNHEMTTGILCKVNQEKTLDVICQTNQLDQESTPDVCCSLLSTAEDAKSNEESELMLEEHASTLEKESLVLTSLEAETVAGPMCAPTPAQGLSALPLLPLHAMLTSNVVRAEENIMGVIPQPGLSPLSCSLPFSEDHSQIQQDQSQTMWAHFDMLSPDSMHYKQSPRRDEQTSSEMKICDPPVSMMSGMPNVMTAPPLMDISIDESQSSGPDSDSNTNDLPLIGTLGLSNCLLKSPEIIENGLSESLPALKTPISASPHPSPEYSDITQTLNKNLEEQGIFKRSPKNNHDHSQIIPLTSLSAIGSVHRSSEMPADRETAICSNDASLENTESESHAFVTVACSQYKDSSTVLGLDHKLSQDVPNLDICHPPIETINFMDLHIDLKKTDADKQDQQSSPTEQKAQSCQPDMSDIQKTLEPLLRCSEAASNIPSCQTEALRAEEGQCASNQMDSNGNFNNSRKNSIVQKKNTLQGEILCEICFACFRTIPGLKRHKAMKHFAKKNGNTAMDNLQGSASIHKDNPALLDPQVYLHTDSSNTLPSETNVPSFIVNQKELQLNVMHGGTGATEKAKTIIPGAKEKKRTLPSVAKSKKNCKAQKSRDTDDKNGCFELKMGRSSPFSDELLSILKTDILQAITPKFPAAPHESSCLPEKQDKINTTECLEVKLPESFPFKQINSTGQEDVIPCHTEQHNAHKQDLAVDLVEAEMEEGKGFKPKMFGCDRITGNTIHSKFEQSGEDFDEVKETCEQKDICFEDSICTETLAEVSFEVKCEKATCNTDRVDLKLCSIKAASAYTPGPDPDLEALLDDERTFSQLFPRDEEVIRKKCTKVYGKKNKKQKSDSNLLVGKPCSIDSTSSDKKDQHSESHDDHIPITKMRDHCEYETTSIDNAILLDMCHKSTAENDCEKMTHTSDQHGDDIDSGGLGAGQFLCLTEDPIPKTAIEWSSPRDLTDSVAERAQSSETPILCKTEEPTIPCPPQLSGTSAHSSESPTQENTSHFHSIDIQNLNTKFQLPEIQFLEATEEVPVILPIGSDDMTISQVTRPNKRPAERRGRRRIEGGSKPKDKQYKCKVCFTWFLTLGELNFHKLSHNPSPPPTCYMCVQRKFSSREQLRDHLREKHAKNKAGIWTCGMCLKEISDVWMYNEHLREHATQFARKGQTQSSILGMQGCFMQETAVKNFITSIMQHQSSKSSRGESGKMSSKEVAKTAKENVEQDPKTSEGGETTVVKTKVHSVGAGKRSTPILSDIPHKADVAQKNVAMHPNCKDPSRDCHHCGKQFPKPFKLQRHLVVHSLQKIFLCSKCPISYQDAKELKDHLKSEHEETDEPDSKHTTLYTCELCADVMHVIKKSFICSTCNYTFSKKEQFDRHMEKHLSGGNKIFKFRGVVRPSKPSSSTNDGEFDLPPGKRRKLSSENSIANIASGQFDQSSELLVPRPMSATSSDFTETSNTPSSSSKDADIKTEDIAVDVSEILSELEHSRQQVVSEPLCLPEDGEPYPTSEPAADAQTSEACEEDEKPLSEVCDIKDENHLHSDLCQKPCNVLPSVLKECQDTKGETGSSVATLNPLPEDMALETPVKAKVQEVDLSDSAQSIEVSHVHLNENLMKISEASNMLKEDSQPCGYKDGQWKSSESAVELKGRDEKRDHAGEVQRNETEEIEPKVVNCAEQHREGQSKEVVVAKLSNTNCSPDDSPRPVVRGHGVTQSAKNCFKPTAIISGRSEEKDLIRQQKRRKEMKVTQSSKVSSSATRENQDVDVRNRKRLRVQSPSKCIWTGGYRKADAASDYPVLSSVRDDMASNKILPKHKAGGLNLQPKRNSFDSNSPKKVEATHHAIGTYKGRKGVPGRSLHSPVSKKSVPIVNNSFNKYRPLSGRPVESHSYRTAESQNNLLSQLFGQKLTSFKIPLRKDTSEALN